MELRTVKIARMEFDRLSMMKWGGISSSLFKSMLDLMPPDTAFVGCGFDGMKNIDYMFFTSDQFIDTPQSKTIPDIYCRFLTNNGIATAESIDFGNAMPNIHSLNVNGHYSTLTVPSTSVPSVSATCNHSWTMHQGLRDSYEYCKMCNVRKP